MYEKVKRVDDIEQWKSWWEEEAGVVDKLDDKVLSRRDNAVEIDGDDEDFGHDVEGSDLGNHADGQGTGWDGDRVDHDAHEVQKVVRADAGRELKGERLEIRAQRAAIAVLVDLVREHSAVLRGLSIDHALVDGYVVDGGDDNVVLKATRAESESTSALEGLAEGGVLARDGLDDLYAEARLVEEDGVG